MSDLRRSKRQRQPTTFFDDRFTCENATQPKRAKKTTVPPPETRPADDTPPPEVRELVDQPAPTYTPPIQVEYVPFKIYWIENDPFSLFIKFLGETSLQAIVAATNARAATQMGPHPKYVRPWSPLCRGELLCWLGLLLYIVNYTGKRRDEQWQYLRRFMSQERWEQIHRFLTFNINTTSLPQNEPLPEASQGFLRSRLEPIYSTIRANCQNAVTPSSWVAVDEAMVPFCGRSKHTVKQKKKPVK